MAQITSYAYASLTIGLALAIGLITWQGLDAVAAVLAVGGWSLVLLGVAPENSVCRRNPRFSKRIGRGLWHASISA